MPFTIDENSLLIKGRKGDTASFTFNFSQDISQYDVHFFVKKNINDTLALIEKTYEKPSTRSVTVNLTTQDTKNLNAKSGSYNIYYWGLKINKGTEFAQTLIPQEFNNPPVMYVYPEIGEV